MGDINQLRCKELKSTLGGVDHKEPTYQTNTISVLVLLYVSDGLSIRHPLRHNLERIDRNAKAPENVWMIQLHPQRDVPAEFLRVLFNGFPQRGEEGYPPRERSPPLSL